MTHREILGLRLKIETDPILTDEEIEYIWIAMDIQEPMKVTDFNTNHCKCPACDSIVDRVDYYCRYCGQRLE